MVDVRGGRLYRFEWTGVVDTTELLFGARCGVVAARAHLVDGPQAAAPERRWRERADRAFADW